MKIEVRGSSTRNMAGIKGLARALLRKWYDAAISSDDPCGPPARYIQVQVIQLARISDRLLKKVEGDHRASRSFILIRSDSLPVEGQQESH